MTVVVRVARILRDSPHFISLIPCLYPNFISRRGPLPLSISLRLTLSHLSHPSLAVSGGVCSDFQRGFYPLP